MRKTLLAALLLLIGTGCRTRPLDGDTGTDANVRVDAASPVDARPPRCDTHQLVAVPLRAFTAPDTDDAGGGNRYASDIRVLLTFPWRPACDVPGQPTATATHDQSTAITTVNVTATLWRSSASDAECGAPVDGNVLLVASDVPQVGNFNSAHLSFVDGAGGDATLFLSIRSAPLVVSCEPRQLGQGCDADCQCQMANAESRCIPCGGGLIGCAEPVFGHCAISCWEDAQCTDARPTCGGDATVPASCGVGACASPCPRGQSCVASKSAPGGAGCRPPTTASDLATCACSDECGASRVCIPGDPPHCVTPCANDADCPGNSGGGHSFVCEDSQCTAH